MRVNLPVKYSQWDKRWGKILLGFNTQIIYTIYNYGCLLSCLAMIARYFGKETDPELLNEELKKKNGFVKGGGDYIWGSITKVFSNIQEVKVDTPSTLTDSQISEIKSALDSGLPVIFQIDYNPNTVQPEKHYVLIVNYNSGDENDFTIIDPLGGKERSLKDYLGWFKPNARNTIEQYIIYTGPKPVQSAGTINISKSDYDKLNHKADQWIRILSYLGIIGDPSLTPFEDAQRVIAGYKSASTDAQNKITDLTTEVLNREEQVGRLKQQLLDSEKLYNSLKDELNKALKLNENMEGLYKGRIDTLQGQVDTISIEKGELNKTIASKEVEIKTLKDQVEKLAEDKTGKISLKLFFQILINKIRG